MNNHTRTEFCTLSNLFSSPYQQASFRVLVKAAIETLRKELLRSQGDPIEGLTHVKVRRCKKVCVNGQITPGGDHEHETIGQEESSNGRPGVQH